MLCVGITEAGFGFTHTGCQRLSLPGKAASPACAPAGRAALPETEEGLFSVFVEESNGAGAGNSCSHRNPRKTRKDSTRKAGSRHPRSRGQAMGRITTPSTPTGMAIWGWNPSPPCEPLPCHLRRSASPGGHDPAPPVLVGGRLAGRAGVAANLAGFITTTTTITSTEPGVRSADTPGSRPWLHFTHSRCRISPFRWCVSNLAPRIPGSRVSSGLHSNRRRVGSPSGTAPAAPA